jgi:hypothetical protein
MTVDPKVSVLLDEIKASRANVLREVVGLSLAQGSAKADLTAWSLQDILEHLVLAERGGFDLICTAAERFRDGDPVFSGQSENNGLSIEAIIERTWKTRETAPESATPTGDWSVGVWASHLRNCDDLLRDLPGVLDGLPLEQVIYPHFLCGPLNAIQRLEFIRFHIDRHMEQIRRVKQEMGV